MNTEPCEYCGCDPCDCDWGMNSKKKIKKIKKHLTPKKSHVIL
mgnify:FL=1